MTEKVQSKKDDVLLKLIERLEAETKQTPIDLSAVMTLSQAIKVLAEMY